MTIKPQVLTSIDVSPGRYRTIQDFQRAFDRLICHQTAACLPDARLQRPIVLSTATLQTRRFEVGFSSNQQADERRLKRLDGVEEGSDKHSRCRCMSSI